MYNQATSFNGDLSSWNTSNVVYMSYMFAVATSFNGDLSSWDISNVTDFRYMFNGATSFNQDLCLWKNDFPYGGFIIRDNVVYDNAVGIFTDSGCTNTSTPKKEQKGPFCASDCD